MGSTGGFPSRAFWPCSRAAFARWMRVNQSSSTSVGGLRTGSSGFGFVIIGSSNSWALATYLPAGQATDSIRANDLPGSSPGDFCRGALLNRRVLETASSKGCASSGRLLPGSPSLRPIAGLRSCPPGPRHNLGLVVAHNVSLEDLGSGSMQAPFALSSRPRRVRTTVKDVEVRYESIGGGYDLARELVPRIAGRLATGTLRAAGAGSECGGGWWLAVPLPQVSTAQGRECLDCVHPRLAETATFAPRVGVWIGAVSKAGVRAPETIPKKTRRLDRFCLVATGGLEPPTSAL